MDAATLIGNAMNRCASFDYSMQDVIQTMEAICETESDPYVSRWTSLMVFLS